MATTYQNLPHPPAKKSRVKKTLSQQHNSRITNKDASIKIRFGNNSSQNSMYKPTSILKKTTQPRKHIYDDSFSENMFALHQPTDLEFIRSRPFYSPLRTPPRLRTLITPPGVEPYRNRHNLRRITSPLPTVDHLSSVPVDLDTWGLTSTDYNLNMNANLIRRYPSPLSHIGLGSGNARRKKSYIVVPRLNNLLSPPVSNSIGGTYIVPTRRIAPVYYPTLHYAYRDGVNYFPSRRLHRESTDLTFIQHNEAFANRYVDDFIGKHIEDQLIPDILLEVIAEIDREKRQGDKFYRSEIHRYNEELTRRMNNEEIDQDLLSDHWVREFDYQRSLIPTSKFDSNSIPLGPLDAREVPYMRTADELRYHDLPTDAQGHILANINQDLVDYEVRNMLRELSSQALHNPPRQVPIPDNTYYDTYDISQRPVDDAQYHAIENHAQSKLLDTIILDQLIRKYIKQKGSSVDEDDASRLLDGTMLHNLINQYQDIDESRSRTLDNYATNKFHLNSFMNVTMDTLLLELSNSLTEDMKDLDEQEQKLLR